MKDGEEGPKMVGFLICGAILSTHNSYGISTCHLLSIPAFLLAHPSDINVFTIICSYENFL